MSIDFPIPDEWAQTQSRLRAFIAEQVIALESDARQGRRGPKKAGAAN